VRLARAMTDVRHSLFRPLRMSKRVSAVERTRSATKKEGGGTFQQSGEEAPMNARYVYNPEPTSSKVRKGGTFAEHAKAQRKLHHDAPGIHTGSRYVGTYVDEKGQTHYDPSKGSDDLDEAKRGAIAADQHSIWDRVDKKEIVVCTHGKCRHFDK
jgi:hypothetical protein